MAKEFVTSSRMMGDTRIRVYTPEKRITSLKVTACDKVVRQIELTFSMDHGFSNKEIDDIIKPYCSFMHYWCVIKPHVITIIKAREVGLLKKINGKWMFKVDVLPAKNVGNIITDSIRAFKKGKEGKPLFYCAEDYAIQMSKNDIPVIVKSSEFLKPENLL